MKALILYRPGSEHSRVIEEFVHDFSRQYPDRRIEVLSLDSRDGAATAGIYDISEYPAILALANDGQLLQQWTGANLPLMRDVAYYVDDARQSVAP